MSQQKKKKTNFTPKIWYEVVGTPFFLEEEKQREQILTDFATELKSHKYIAILAVTKKNQIEIEYNYSRTSTTSRFYLGLAEDDKPILYKYINSYNTLPEPRKAIKNVSDDFIEFSDGTYGQIIWLTGFERLVLEGVLSVIYPLEISPLQIETFLEVVTDDGSEQRFKSYLGSILSRSARYISHTSISSSLLELKNSADDLQTQINSGKQPAFANVAEREGEIRFMPYSRLKVLEKNGRAIIAQPEEIEFAKGERTYILTRWTDWLKPNQFLRWLKLK